MLKMPLKELEAMTVLSGAPLIGSVKSRLLIKHFGSAAQAIEAGPEAWSLLPGFGAKIADGWQRWLTGGQWEKNLELAEKHGVEIIPYTGAKFPKRLLDLPDHPVLLYVKGEIKAEDEQSVAVVGTRQASIYGNEMAEKISGELAAMRYTIVSGLARGIDTTAHASALRKGRTIAVIGSGLADIYPKENGRLAAAIAEKGALISEFPMAAPPDRQNFPQRNRIVSGMTLATVLIEAPIKSGAMITMERAWSQKRKLFAIPGRADSDNFRGNHSLIKEGKARLIENGKDVAESFSDLFHFMKTDAINNNKQWIPLEDEEHRFLSSLPNEELSFDKIVETTKLPVMKINVLLMSLLLKKAVREYPGKTYKKLV